MPNPLRSAALPTTSYIGRIDPRARVVVAVLTALIVAVADRPIVAAMALMVAGASIVLSGMSPRTVLARLVPLNMLILLLALTLPLTTGGPALFSLGGVDFSREGLILAGTIALKGNAIVLALLVLIGSMDATALGHALTHLRMPRKLTHLMLFTVRYIDVLHREYVRLRVAMRARGFRPKMNRHTYQSYGYLAGMLLVRSFDRSERIVAAMKCRGFAGRFFMLDHFAFSRRDVTFCVGAALLLALLVSLQWI